MKREEGREKRLLNKLYLLWLISWILNIFFRAFTKYMYSEHTEGKDSMMVGLSWQTWCYQRKKNDWVIFKRSMAVSFWKLLDIHAHEVWKIIVLVPLCLYLGHETAFASNALFLSTILQYHTESCVDYILKVYVWADECDNPYNIHALGKNMLGIPR